jgi:hypothetical protein
MFPGLAHPTPRAPGALLAVALCAVSPLLAGADGDLTMAALDGAKMTAADRDRATAQAAADPADATSRARLLGYYFFNSGPERLPLVLWFIDQHPDDDFAGTPYTQVIPFLDAAGYQQGARHWLKQVRGDDVSAARLLHAAAYFTMEPVRDEALLQRGCTAYPKDARFPEQLGELSLRGGDAIAAFSNLEQALTLTTDPTERFDHLADVAKAAFAAGDDAKAKAYASELVASAAKIQDWNTGNAIHHGNAILGRIAVHDGDLPLAISFLIKSGQTPGSPQLDSFGPNMALAKDLLDKGEKDSVVRYLDLCAAFWKDGHLATWKADIRAGRTPDFGANLSY